MLQKKDESKIMFGTKGVFAVASSIFSYPHRSFHIRELAKQNKCSTTAITEGVRLLTSYNIITVEKDKLSSKIKANLQVEAYTHYKLIYNLYMLLKGSLLKNLIAFFKPECIVLFGSFARGEDIEGSDIDIFILSSRKEELKTLNEIGNQYEKALNRKINLHLLSSLSKTGDDFKNALVNGIVLYGYLKVI